MPNRFDPKKMVAKIRKRKYFNAIHKEKLEKLLNETDNFTNYREEHRRRLTQLNATTSALDNYHRTKKLKKGGSVPRSRKPKKVVDENKAMVLSQNKAIAHHTDELKTAINKSDKKVEAWVVGKVERASTDISDVTHYLEGQTEYAEGGKIAERYFVVETFPNGRKRKLMDYPDYDTAEVYARMKTNFRNKGNVITIENSKSEVMKEFKKGGKMEMGGQVGDNALVLSANKMGYITEVGNGTYTLRFPEGTQSVFKASELQIMKDDEFAKGGYIVSEKDGEGYVYILDSNGKKVPDNKIPKDIGYGNVKNKFVSKKAKYDTEMGKTEAKQIVSRMNDTMADGGEMQFIGITDDEGNLIDIKVGDEVVQYKKRYTNQEKEQVGGKGRVISINGGFAKVSYGNDYEQWVVLGELKKMADGGEVGTWKSNALGDGALELSNSNVFIRDNGGDYGRGRYDVYQKGEYNSRNSFRPYSLIGSMDDLDEAKMYGYNNRYSKGGMMDDGAMTNDGIGFIPMDLEQKLMITAKWGGTDIKGVIGILNAMIDSNITDEDLLPKPTKSGSAFEKAVAKKTQEIWAKIEPNYKGNFIGNKYYGTIRELVERSTTSDEILKRYKPFRKYQKNSVASNLKMAEGGMMTDGGRYNIVDDGKVVETNVTYSKVIDYANTIAFYDIMDESDMGEVNEIANFEEAVNYLGMVDVEVVQVGADGMAVPNKTQYFIENMGSLKGDVEFILEMNDVNYNTKGEDFILLTTTDKIKFIVSDIEDIDDPKAQDIVVRTINNVLHGTYVEPTKKRFTEGMSEKTAEKILKKLGVVGNAPTNETQKARSQANNGLVLFTPEIDKKLFEQYKFGSDLDKQDVVVKIFNPYGQGTWYIMNADPDEPDYLWGIVDLFETEMGSISRDELVSLRISPLKFKLERDISFKPTNAKVIFDGLMDGKHFKFGGSVTYNTEQYFDQEIH